MSKRTVISYSNIPDELKNVPQWIVWRYGDYKGTTGKYPKLPSNAEGITASWKAPSTWMTFNQARDAYERNKGLAGMGFVLTKETGIVCIDLDGTGDSTELEKYFSTSYLELSASGNGYHSFIEAEHEGGSVFEGWEVYSQNRWIAITGDVVNEVTVVEELQDNFDTFFSGLQPKTKVERPNTSKTAPKAKKRVLTDADGLKPYNATDYDLTHPMNLYRATHNVSDELVKRGYKIDPSTTPQIGQLHYVRPGKESGLSVVVHIEANVCKVFSTNDKLWDAQERKEQLKSNDSTGTFLTSFDIYCEYTCNGNFKQAISCARRDLNMPSYKR